MVKSIKKGWLHSSYDWTKVVIIILLSYKPQWKQIENCYQLMVPLVLVHCELAKKTYNGYWLNISTDNHVTKQKNNQKRKYLGTNSPNQEETLAQICSGFLENPPVIQWHKTNDISINTKNVLDKNINCTSNLSCVQANDKDKRHLF